MSVNPILPGLYFVRCISKSIHAMKVKLIWCVKHPKMFILVTISDQIHKDFEIPNLDKTTCQNVVTMEVSSNVIKKIDTPNCSQKSHKFEIRLNFRRSLESGLLSSLLIFSLLISHNSGW